ncbi:MAG TPA: hypothetical protein VFL77_08885 [Solirubrobacterales bacterium]|nr:hypothetical protein [Solirubrobacterales bacterium]
MPQILVLADAPDRSEEVVYRERVPRTSLESEHFAGQLLERVGWAVSDADRIENLAPQEPGGDEAPAVPEPAIPVR